MVAMKRGLRVGCRWFLHTQGVLGVCRPLKRFHYHPDDDGSKVCLCRCKKCPLLAGVVVWYGAIA